MTSSRTWSAQQSAIFDWFRDGEGNLVVRARAGTGKTTTLLEGIQCAPENRILLAAFNKSIANELAGRLSNPNAEAKTLHSLGLRFVRRNWSNIRIDSEGERAERIARMSCGDDVPDPIVRLVVKLASKGKTIAPLAKESRPLLGLAYAFDCVPEEEWEEDGYDAEWVAERALAAMELCARTRDGLIDFDDMLFLPIRNRWIRPWFNLVVVDECQDLSRAQILLAYGACKGRMAVVGDDRQAIYGWRGADSGSLDRLKSKLKATELGLTVTYRCPTKVVEVAQKLVPDFTAAANAAPGEVSESAFEKMLDSIELGDFLLSRKNAPLVASCLALLKRGKRARIQGRDIGAGLKRIVRKLGDGAPMPMFLERLTRWAERKITRVLASGVRSADERAAQIRDQADTLQALAEDLSGVRELEARIDDLFTDRPGPRIVCSSVHRAKGLEADRVFVLQDTLRRTTQLEEQNIEYVAITRAKSQLVWVNGLPQRGA